MTQIQAAGRALPLSLSHTQTSLFYCHYKVKCWVFKLERQGCTFNAASRIIQSSANTSEGRDNRKTTGSQRETRWLRELRREMSWKGRRGGRHVRVEAMMAALLEYTRYMPEEVMSTQLSQKWMWVSWTGCNHRSCKKQQLLLSLICRVSQSLIKTRQQTSNEVGFAKIARSHSTAGF